MSKLSRRSLVSTAAALPALAVPAVASTEPDPIFAAIERLRAAVRAHEIICNEEEPDNLHDPRYAEWQAKAWGAGETADIKHWEMFDTLPTTKAGAAALVAFYLELHTEPEELYDQALLRALGEAIPHLA